MQLPKDIILRRSTARLLQISGRLKHRCQTRRRWFRFEQKIAIGIALPSTVSFHLVEVVGGEQTVLAVRAEHPGSAVAARHAAVGDAVEQGASAKAVVTVHAARNLT